jgi:SAM-dependent methyltransferase
VNCRTDLQFVRAFELFKSDGVTGHTPVAQMGYQVTAVEIEKDFVEVIRRRADAIGVEIKLVNQDMAAFEPSEQFDAALFFECFHHCADHLRLINNLDRFITPDGLVAFAAEPIVEFSHPWGFVRNDGLTLWSIRKWGWFELGFDSSYFLRTLLFNGWSPRWIRDNVSLLTSVIIARKSHGYYELRELSLPPDEEATWSLSKSGDYFVTTKSVLSCDRRSHVAALEICLSNFASDERHAALTAGKATSHVKLPAHAEKVIVRLQPEDWQGEVTASCLDRRQPHAHSTRDDRTSGIAVHWLRLLKG